jgi:N-acetylglutamate synthase-like GNAT family acetyltransferase
VADTALLQRLERYLDAVPRSGAGVEAFGPLTLFTRIGAGWPYYARPTFGWPGPVTAVDLEAVRARQRELAIPEAFEWVDDTTPSFRPVAEAAGLVVEQLPLMALGRPLVVTPPPDVGIRIVPFDDPGLAAASAVAEIGFGAPGTAAGTAGPGARDEAVAAMSPDALSNTRERMRRGLTIMAVAESDAEGPLCVGWHQPVDDTSEVVGVATLPSARRRGLAAALTARLVADALQRGVATIFLTAGSDDVARVYARVGFARVGTSCVAAPPA